MNVAIVLAGGTGTRLGENIPKQFIKVLGKPVLAYTLEIFQNDENIDAIEIVCHKDWMDETNRICEEYGITKKRWMCEGGDTFQSSTMNGAFNLKGELDYDDIVVVSFGVSPLTPQEDIDDSIRVAKEHGIAVSAADIDLSTCVKDDEYSSTQNVIRETLKGFGNPWTYRFGELVEVYETCIANGLINEIEPHTTSLYFALGKRIWFSKCTSIQHKITRKGDLDMFEGYLLLQQQREKENKK